MKSFVTTFTFVILICITTSAFASGNKKANKEDITTKNIETAYTKAPVLDKETCDLKLQFDLNLEGMTAAFSNKTVGEYTSIEWTFGDGTTLTAADGEHTYEKAGVYYYTVLAYNADNGCADFVSGQHYVGPTKEKKEKMAISFVPND